MEVRQDVHLSSISLEEVKEIIDLSEEKVFAMTLNPDGRGLYKGELLFTLNDSKLLEYLESRRKNENLH